MDQNLTQEIKNLVITECPQHQQNIYQVCISDKCNRFLDLNCTECYQTKHPEHSHSYVQILNVLLQKANILQEQQQKEQQQPQVNQSLRNEFQGQQKELKIIGQRCISIADSLQTFIDKLFNNNSPSPVKEQLITIIDTIKNKENKDLTQLQVEIKKFEFLLDFSDPKQLKLKQFHAQTQKSEEYLKLLKTKIIDLNELLNQLQQQCEQNPIEIQQIPTFKLDVDSSKLIKKQDENLFCEWFEKKDLKLTLLYQASRDGFSASSFHQKCDNKGKTLAIIKSDNGCLFGGYANQPWNSSSSYINDSEGKCFIFSIDKKTKFKLQSNSNALIGNSSYGPIFGGSTVIISDKSNENSDSYSNLANNYYEGPAEDQATTFLTGSKNFRTAEIEVFLVQ